MQKSIVGGTPLPTDGIYIEAHPELSLEVIDPSSPIILGLNKTFDLSQFRIARRPHSLGLLTDQEAAMLSAQLGAPKVTDLPIKFPGSNFRLPGVYAQLAPLIRRIANFERRINPNCFDEYYCYLTVHQSLVAAGAKQRPSPCHVDGFQGARWRPKVRTNHSYLVASSLPTVFHEQAFALEHLDDARHNFFWEMNSQVEEAAGAHAWMPEANELVLMDCYCVHQGTAADIEVFRTFVRVSFEVRIFDHIDNGVNPLFAYDWPRADRHIGTLGLTIHRQP